MLDHFMFTQSCLLFLFCNIYYVCVAGYAAAANPFHGYGGSTELECLHQAPNWFGNSPTATSTNVKMLPVKYHTNGRHQETCSTFIR